jgi:hypothetical protein
MHTHQNSSNPVATIGVDIGKNTGGGTSENGVTSTVPKPLADRGKMTQCSAELCAAVAKQHFPQRCVRDLISWLPRPWNRRSQ